MFKEQSLTLSFKSYLKRPEKTTSNVMRRKNVTLEATSPESQEKMFWRAKRHFSNAQQMSDDEMRGICSGAIKPVIRVFNMGGIVSLCQHKIVSFSFTN